MFLLQRLNVNLSRRTNLESFAFLAFQTDPEVKLSTSLRFLAIESLTPGLPLWRRWCTLV
jgi:hypothetical protein